MKNKKFLIVVVVILLFSIVTISTKALLSKSKEQMINYLALGDGLTLGINSSGMVGENYVDYLGEELKEEQVIQNYYKEFSKNNLKTSELLKIVEKDAIGIINGKSQKISSLIKSSKIITISIGLSDIINYFTYSPMDKTVYYQKESILNKMNLVQINLFNIIEEILNISPTSQILVIGTYFLYPWIILEQRESTIEMFNAINKYYQEVASDTGVSYIDISCLGDQQYLSSQIFYYPGEDGYRLIASKIKENITAI